MDFFDENDYFEYYDDGMGGAAIPSSSAFQAGDYQFEEDDLELDEEEFADLLIQDTRPESSSGHTTPPSFSGASVITAVTATTKRKFVLSAEARERRNRRRRLNVVPRILKCDIRRDYAAMLTNVLNAFDADLMKRFMNRFCTDDCQLLDYVPEGVAFGVTPVTQLEGQSAIIKFWVNNARYVPDFICQTNDTQLRISLSDGKSKIISNTRFRGTKCFQPANTDYEKRLKKFVLKGYHQQNLVVDDRGLRLTGVPEEEYINMLNCDVDWLAHRLYHLPLNIPPVDLNLEGTFTLYVDSQNRIYKFEFLSSEVNRQQQSSTAMPFQSFYQQPQPAFVH